MVNRSKQIGTEWETRLRDLLRGDGYDVERLALSGPQDEGDLVLKLGPLWSDTFIIEAKAEKGLNLAGWIKEAQAEAQNYALHRGIEVPHFAVVSKRRNHPASQAYVHMTLAEWLRQIGT